MLTAEPDSPDCCAIDEESSGHDRTTSMVQTAAMKPFHMVITSIISWTGVCTIRTATTAMTTDQSTLCLILNKSIARDWNVVRQIILPRPVSKNDGVCRGMWMHSSGIRDIARENQVQLDYSSRTKLVETFAGPAIQLSRTTPFSYSTSLSIQAGPVTRDSIRGTQQADTVWIVLSPPCPCQRSRR